MPTYQVTAPTMDPTLWRNIDPNLGALQPLISTYALRGTGAGPLVARAWRRQQALTSGRLLVGEMTLRPVPDVNAYVRQALTTADLKGLCYMAADEITQYLKSKGAPARTVRIEGRGSDHYFTLLNTGTVDTSLIIDATWAQFCPAGRASAFCLVLSGSDLKKKIVPWEATFASSRAFNPFEAYREALGWVAKGRGGSIPTFPG